MKNIVTKYFIAPVSSNKLKLESVEMLEKIKKDVKDMMLFIDEFLIPVCSLKEYNFTFDCEHRGDVSISDGFVEEGSMGFVKSGDMLLIIVDFNKKLVRIRGKFLNDHNISNFNLQNNLQFYLDCIENAISTINKQPNISDEFIIKISKYL